MGQTGQEFIILLQDPSLQHAGIIGGHNNHLCSVYICAVVINLQLFIHVASHFTGSVKIIAMTSFYLETNGNHRHRFVWEQLHVGVDVGDGDQGEEKARLEMLFNTLVV